MYSCYLGVRMLDGMVNDAVEARSLSLNPSHIGTIHQNITKYIRLYVGYMENRAENFRTLGIETNA